MLSERPSFQSADNPPHKAGQSAVYVQKPTEPFEVLSKCQPHNCGQSASQGPDCPHLKETPHQKLASFGGLAQHTGGQSEPQGRTVCCGQIARHQKHTSFWWPPQPPLRTVRPTGPDSPQWTHTLQPETYKFLVLSLISPMDSQPQKPGQSAVHQNCFFKRSSS